LAMIIGLLNHWAFEWPILSSFLGLSVSVLVGLLSGV
jgi:hypothetical protein